MRSPTAGPAAAGSRSSVTGSTSQKTGIAPSYSRQLAEATKLNGLVITSSPGPQPSARTPRCRAAVPEETATASSTPSQAAKSRSKRSSTGPSDSRPERRTSSTSSSSRAPRSGLASGIGSGWLTRRREGAPARTVARAAGRGLRGWKAYSSESTRASHDASMMFSETPIDPQERSPVGGVQQHARHRVGAVVRIEDPDLVVDQLDLGQVRMELGDRLAQRTVERVDRPLALGGADVAPPVHPDLDRRLRLHLAVIALLGDHPEALEPEERLVGAHLASQQQLEGGVGRLVLVAEVLALLQPLDGALRGVGVEVDSGALGAADDGARARQLGDQDVAAVADQRGVGVLEGARVGLHPGHVHAALVGEGIATHVGPIWVRRQVAELVDEVGGLGQPPQPSSRARSRSPSSAAAPEGSRPGSRSRTAPRSRSSSPAPAEPRRPRRRASWRPRTPRRCAYGCRPPCVAQRPHHRGGRPADLGRQAGAVRVAEGDVLGAGRDRRSQAVERVGGVLPPGVEEVLRVVTTRLPWALRRRSSPRSCRGSPRARPWSPCPGEAPRSCRPGCKPAPGARPAP